MPPTRHSGEGRNPGATRSDFRAALDPGLRRGDGEPLEQFPDFYRIKFSDPGVTSDEVMSVLLLPSLLLVLLPLPNSAINGSEEPLVLAVPLT
jgi:hypothetical protein